MHEDQTVDTYPGCKTVAGTRKALLVDIPGYGQKWVPQSVIDDTSESYRHSVITTSAAGSMGKLVVKGWWSMKMLEEHAEQAKKAKAP